MAKLTRVFQKIFSGEAPLAQVAQFGSFAENAPMKSKDPSVIQSLASWTTGWYSAVRGAYSPTIQDMNAVMLVLSYQIAYLMQQGIAEWNSETTYYLDSVVRVDGVEYVSIQNDNTNNAITDTSWWLPKGVNIRTISTDATTLTKYDETVLYAVPFAGTLSGNLPQASTCKGKKFVLVNSGEGPLTINPFAGDLIGGLENLKINNPLSTKTIQSDGGTNWYVI